MESSSKRDMPFETGRTGDIMKEEMRICVGNC